MADITLIPENLDELDRLDRDLLVLTFFSDERPLRGLNGLIDWRMNGRLSHLLKKGDLTGEKGERTLMSPNRRLNTPRLLLLGLGRSDRFDNTMFIHVIGQLFDIISGLNTISCAMSLPGARFDEHFMLERLAILTKRARSDYPGKMTLLVGGNETFKDIRAKFDLILDEVDKVMGPKSSGGRPS